MTGVALITGGQRGIGLGIATALSRAGWAIAMVAERPPEDPQVQQALAQLGDGACYRQHDLRDTGNIAPLLDEIESTQGPVTSLVSNAGIPAPGRGDMLDVAPEALDLVMNVNLNGGYFLAQDIAKRMLKRGPAPYQSMTFVTSVSAQMVSVERAEYCISKAAASMMARLFAARLAEAGIGVFELRPGIIATDMTATVKDKYDVRIADGLVPARRWGTPADIGTVVCAIAAGQMAYATGAVIPVDGGLSIPQL